MNWLLVAVFSIIGIVLGAIFMAMYVIRKNSTAKEWMDKASANAGRYVSAETKITELLELCRESGYDYTYNDETHEWQRKFISGDSSTKG